MSISDIIRAHADRAVGTINLVASENLTSPAVRMALASDLGHRYCIPPLGERPAALWDYPNQEAPRGVLAATQALACRLFGAAYADVRPLSGNQVAQIVLGTLVARGETAWSVPAGCGGHFTTAVVAEREGLRLEAIPYDHRRGVIDVDKVAAAARRNPPVLVFLDSSMQLFPHPLRDLRAALGPDTVISYDASHTFGLIAGGGFQDPLGEGADLLHGSTHKSLWGPQKGMILARDDGALAARLRDAVAPLFVSNIHVHHVAALGIALEEAEAYGAAYAARVVENARAMGAALAAEGMDVPFADAGCTRSHQVFVVLGDQDRALRQFERLERAGLHANAVRVPFCDAFGLRIGLAEATRRGMDASVVAELARCVAAVCLAGRDPVAVAGRVAEISRAHPGLCFAAPPAAQSTAVAGARRPSPHPACA